MTRSHHIVVVTIVAIMSTAVARAQTIRDIDPAKLPRFEVASVKPADANATSGRIGFPPARFIQEHTELVNTVTWAFSLGFEQMAEPRPRLLLDRFDIDARAPAGTSRTDMALMLRALLIDRFKLRYHIDQRQVDGYRLVVARADRRLGPNMRKSQIDCVARLAALATKQPVEPLRPGAAECGIRNGPGLVTFTGMSMSSLAARLSSLAGKRVVDDTSLAGGYDVELRYALPSANRQSGQPAAFDDAPSIFTAVQEQLGLGLTPAKTRVDVLVVDHIERPDAD
jgi:uncharacterized protein (TIGR03435 family)